MKYYKKANFEKVLFEQTIQRHGAKMPDPSYMQIFFESITNTVILTEDAKEQLSTVIDDVMFFFKNIVANNARVSDLIKLQKKTLPLGGLAEKSPALTKAMSLIFKEVQSNDKLKTLIKYWFDYLLKEYKGVSPIVAFNKELYELEKSLKNSKNNTSLQGEQGDVDKVLGAEGIIPVFVKLSDTLLNGTKGLTNPKDQTSGKIEHERFGDRKPLNIPDQNSITNDYTYYQERGMPRAKNPSANFESAIFEALLAAISKN